MNSGTNLKKFDDDGGYDLKSIHQPTNPFPTERLVPAQITPQPQPQSHPHPHSLPPWHDPPPQYERYDSSTSAQRELQSNSAVQTHTQTIPQPEQLLATTQAPGVTAAAQPQELAPTAENRLRHHHDDPLQSVSPRLSRLRTRLRARIRGQGSAEDAHVVGADSALARTDTSSVSFLSTTEVDLTRTKLIRGQTFVVNAATIMGGVRITVPADVEVVNENVLVLGGVITHKNPYFSGEPTSRVLIRGVAVLSGVRVVFANQMAQYD
ncbi:uncharacterized protein BJ171DRAFT_596306 [Polychytrium aggregatum]|uniref:uncharacterized protein n=1 Tax=Polychytrium aggregatum TaxID=110093 RepID=UPI0022FE35F7|nr:uncharacterized protein BJ171DRAFT_596306 [Polychytrium aggregatum]KAI9207880.1 hypothetical protein BJ171DRAFT_596306 [Polychytrium aggregatum]